MHFRINLYLIEQGFVLQRPINLPHQYGPKINLAFGSIIKPHT